MRIDEAAVRAGLSLPFGGHSGGGRAEGAGVNARSWVIEAAIVVAVFVAAAWWSTAYWNASFTAGRQPFFYQEYFEPAVMMACGKGFVISHPQISSDGSLPVSPRRSLFVQRHPGGCESQHPGTSIRASGGT